MIFIYAEVMLLNGLNSKQFCNVPVFVLIGKSKHCKLGCSTDTETCWFLRFYTISSCTGR